MRCSAKLVLGGICVALLTAGAGHGRSLIAQAYQAGELDWQTATLYELQAVRDPQLLPARYRDASPSQIPVCGTPLVVQALAAAQAVGGTYPAPLAKILVRRETEARMRTASGHFVIHYDLSGRAAVDPLDANSNGVPDYVDEVARTLEYVWTREIDELGFRPPPGDGNLGGGPEYDVYIRDLATGRAYGFTYPESGGNTTHSYLELDNNYADAIYDQTHGLEALHATVAHEFNHALQFGYYQGSDGIWWQEATATWMEDVVYPEVDDYLQYLPSFLLYPEKSLDSGSRFASTLHIYGASLFAHFLHQHYDVDVIRAIWAEFGARGNADISHLDKVIREYDAGGLANAVAEFAVWNYFTGWRHRPGYYAEGEKYPAVRMREIAVDTTTPRVPVEHTDEVDHLASTYLRLQPQLVLGGVSLDASFASGRWRRHLILSLAGGDSVRVLSPAAGVIHVPGWDSYDEVVLVLTETDPTGLAFGCRATVTYDPDLLDEPPPLALRLGPVFPNPFRPPTHRQMSLPYALDQVSTDTRLSIFDAHGTLVRVFILGARGRRRGMLTWDGANQAGKLVDSGIYYGVLNADGRHARTTLAVIRGTSH